MANKPTQDEKASSMTVRRVEAMIHHGPLPDPLTLEQYNKTVPGAAERIIQIFEAQANHRMAMENEQIKDMQNRTAIEQTYAESETKIAEQGVWFAFIISLIAIIGGLYMIIFAGHEYIGTIFSCAGLAPLIGNFINGTKSHHNESK